VLLLVSLTEECAIYLGLELDRSWTEIAGVTTIARLWTLRSMTCNFAKLGVAECRPCNLLHELPYVIHFKGAPNFGEAQASLNWNNR